MKWFRRFFLFMLIFPITPFFLAFGQTEIPMEPQSLSEVMALLPLLAEGISNKNYVYVLTIILMVVVFGIKKFVLPKDSSKDHLIPGITAGLGAVLASVTALFAGTDPISASVGGLLLGNAASGAYDTFVKPIKQKRKKLKNK